MDTLSSVKGLCVMSVLFVMAGCAGTPDVNPMMQEVEQAYNETEKDTLVLKNAPVALREAEEALQRARQSASSGEAESSVERQAYLAMQRVKIARKTAELRAAREQMQRASTELKILMNNIRESERKQNGMSLAQKGAEERARQLRNFSARETERGLVIRFLNLNFERESASLTSRVEGSINELADFLEAYPERNIRIEGHTDNTGSANFNRTLSQERANVVRDALISRGINTDRIEAVGFGEQYPIAPNDTEAARRQNRRVEVVISDESGVIGERR